jgi:hypothetical protein
MARQKRAQQVSRRNTPTIVRRRQSGHKSNGPHSTTTLPHQPISAENLLVLQRQIGNQATMRLLAQHQSGRSSSGTIQRNLIDDLKSGQAAREQQKLKHTGMGLRGAARRGDAADLDTSGKERSSAEMLMDVVSGTGQAAGAAGDVSGIADSTLLTLSTTPKSFGTGEKLYIAGSESMSGEVNAASAGVGLGTASLAGFGNFIGLVDSVRTLTDSKKTAQERTMGGIGIAENVAQGGVALGQAAGSAVGSAAAFAGASAVGDISTGAVELLGGVGDAIAQIFATGKGLVTLIWDVVKAFKGEKDWMKVLKENGQALLGGLLPALKRFLGMAKSVMSGVRWILKAVEVGGEFVQAFPLIGNSIGIILKLLSIIEESVKIVIESIRISKAAWFIHKIADVGASALATAEDVVRINWKRIRRHLIPVFTNTGRIIGDLVSISGNVLQIVGVATSAAYGAGVGLMAGGIAATAGGSLLKVGMGATELGFKAARWTKQVGRDLAFSKESKDAAAGKEERGKFGKAMSSIFNTGKTTAAKQAKYKADAAKMLDGLAKLDKVKGSDKEQAEILTKQYKPMMTLVKATGVSLKELKQQESLEKMQEKLVEAMKKR